MIPFLDGKVKERQWCNLQVPMSTLYECRLTSRLLHNVVEEFFSKRHQISIQQTFSMICHITGISIRNPELSHFNPFQKGGRVFNQRQLGKGSEKKQTSHLRKGTEKYYKTIQWCSHVYISSRLSYSQVYPDLLSLGLIYFIQNNIF